MQARFPAGPMKSDQTLSQLASALTLLLPFVLFLVLGIRHPSAGWAQWCGVAVLGGAGLMALVSTRLGREPVGPTVIMLHVLALGWMFLALPHRRLDGLPGPGRAARRAGLGVRRAMPVR